MFNKESESIKGQKAETVIGPSIKVKGDFHGDGDIIIEGSVEGEISTKQFITIGPKAKIIANIKANSAKIAGSVDGDLDIKGFTEIQSTAVINGNLRTDEISIEKGAKIHGKVSMQADKEIINSPESK